MDWGLNINFQNIKWNELGTTNFWFAVDRFIREADKAFLYIGCALVIAGILFLAYKRFAGNRFLAGVAGRISKIFFTIGVLEVIWFGLKYQYVQIFGSRFMAAMLLLIGLIWLYWPIRYLISHYKTDMAEAQREASRAKYLNNNR